MPVMEGKAMLFKEFAEVDAFPICLSTNDPEEIIQTVKLMAPTFGGINLEDISAPRCFEIEERLKEELDIPVFHDDQHGTAVVVMAALFNSLKIVGKPIESLRVLVLGIGAAGRRLHEDDAGAGVTEIIGCDRKGAISTDREDYKDGEMTEIKTLVRREHEPRARLSGGPNEVIEGCDLFVGLSGPGLIEPASLGKMNEDPIVFAMANPTPEVMPEDAEPYVRIMATGRSDYPNQINNVLCFPGVFRGALDAGAPTITEEMKLAAARGIAEVVSDDDLSEDYVIPSSSTATSPRPSPAPSSRRPRRAGLARFSEETGTFQTVDPSADGAAPTDRRRRRGGRSGRLTPRAGATFGRSHGGGFDQHPRRPEEAERADQRHRGRQRRVQQLVGVRGPRRRRPPRPRRRSSRPGCRLAERRCG